ncbi:DUF4340 domain-containing protein [Polyangium aurulentum]|uniref:DUF4340 domain-containing protein n=1 Tax=Polyangium aurulentum TaxID=2567896 RepID=UPI0010ADBCF5|nr:DUF4340 domain-containing protein [Polyangium aurulentum]UQA54930.1 DUF4340 domain-containing protein [Polyangium aurulentum]
MKIPRALGRHATTIVLTTLALGAAAVVFVVDRGSVTTEEAEQRKKNLLVAWRPDDIAEVTLEAHGNTGKLTRSAPDERGQRRWELSIGGERFAAEEHLVDQLLGSLEFATFERAVNPVDRKATGLDAPRARITVRTDKETARIAIGGEAPSPAGAAYVEVEGRGVFVITAQLLASLDVDPQSLRDKAILPYFTADLERIELEGEGGARRFVRAPGADTFRFDGSTPEGNVRVDRGAMDELVAALGRTQAESFPPDDVADRALAPAVTLRLSTKDPAQPTAEIAIGGACPDKPDHVVAIRKKPSRMSACVPKSLLEVFSKPASSFLDRGLFVASVDEVEEVMVTVGDRKIEIARRGTGWHERFPHDTDIQGDSGRALVEALLGVRTTGFITGKDKAALGLDAPRAKIRLISLLPSQAPDGGDGERIEELSVGAADGDVVPVLRADDGAILSVPADAARALFPSEIALRSLVVVDVPETAVRAIRVVEGERAQRIERTAEGGFRLVEPKGDGLAADLGLGSDLAQALAPLRAERWVADKDDGTYGLARPRMTIEAELAAAGDAGARSITIEIGAPSAGGSFARKSGDDAVFLVGKKLESAAGRWLLDRAPFSIDAGEIARATIATGDGKKKLVLERSGGALRIAGGAADAQAAALRDALTDLVPEGAVSVGEKPRKDEGLDPPAVVITVERDKLDPTTGVAAGAIDPGRTLRISLGRGDVVRGTAVVYARLAGVDATYAVAGAKVRPLLDAVGR